MGDDRHRAVPVDSGDISEKTPCVAQNGVLFPPQNRERKPIIVMIQIGSCSFLLDVDCS
jgi:hypothetical protein